MRNRTRAGLILLTALIGTTGCTVVNALAMGQNPYDYLAASEDQITDIEAMAAANPCLDRLVSEAREDGEILQGEYRIIIQAHYRTRVDPATGQCRTYMRPHQDRLRALNAVPTG